MLGQFIAEFHRYTNHVDGCHVPINDHRRFYTSWRTFLYGPVAQLAELWFSSPTVAGSSPVGITRMASKLANALQTVKNLPASVIIDYTSLNNNPKSRPRGGVIFPFEAKVLRLNTNHTSVYVEGPKDQIWQFRLSDGVRLGCYTNRRWHLANESLQSLRDIFGTKQ